jgi:hypothetical protein
MNYVEWLRVRNGLRIYAIVLGALIVLGLIIRISVGGQLGDNEFIVNRIEHDPGTKISHSVVNGLNRTTLVDAAQRTTITIDDQNGGGKLIHIVQPASKDTSGSDHASVGPISYDKTTKNGMESITFNTDAPVNFEIFLAFACFAALIFATVWGCSFACEHGHLEYSLLKPITRTRYGLGLIGVDIVGMAIVGAMTIVAAIICMSMFELPRFDFSRLADPLTAVVFVLPVAWYAMLNAATASLRRGYGAVIGFAWPVALVLIVLSHSSFSDLPVFRVLHTIFVVASRLIPITYLPGFGLNGDATSDVGLSNPVSLAILVGLMLIYGALALVQWRRVEA